LTNLYRDTFKKTYELGFHELFEKTRLEMLGRLERDRKEKVSRSSQDLTGKATGKSKFSSFLGADKETSGSDLDLVERHKFDKLLDDLLSEIEPVCLAEQQFCIKFFHIASDAGTPSNPAAQLTVPTTNLVRTASEELLLASQKKRKTD